MANVTIPLYARRQYRGIRSVVPGFHGFATGLPPWMQARRAAASAVPGTLTSSAAAAVPAAPAAAATPPVTLPVDPRIENYLMQGRGAVDAANAGRLALGTNTAFGLTDSGLLERSGTQVAGTASAGFADAPDLNNITYRVIVGPEGRLYRQAFASIDASAAQRGAAYSSARDNQQAASQQALDNQLNAALRAFNDRQNSSLATEASGLGQIGQNIAQVRAEQAATLAGTPAPAATTPTPTGAVPGATKPAGTTVLPTVKKKVIPGFHGFATNMPRRFF